MKHLAMRCGMGLVLLGYLLMAGAGGVINTEIKVVTVQGDYATLRDDLELAITERGLVISKVLLIADMLQRTGSSVGSTKKIYEQGETLTFCSAVLSRQMMELNPEYIAFCPFKISIYNLPAQPHTVYFTYPIVTLPSEKEQATMQAINQLLVDIVQAVVKG